MNTAWTWSALAGVVLLAAGCNDEPSAPPTDDAQAAPSPDAVVVTIEASADTLVLGESLEWTIKVENGTSQAVDAGAGSSGCRLHAELVEGDATATLIEDRMCTRDYVQYVLQPGEVREETWSWSGAVQGDKGSRTLAPGTYRIEGVAGPFRSVARDVVIVAP